MTTRLRFSTSNPANARIVDDRTGATLFDVQTALNRDGESGPGTFTTSIIDARYGMVIATWQREWAWEPDMVTIRGERMLMSQWLPFMNSGLTM